MSRPSVLIENWLPIAEIGVESQREHAYGAPFPAPNRLHVWWARRPLIASRAAILTGVLPIWSKDWTAPLLEKFPTEEKYRNWVTYLLGIRGDPVKGMKLAKWAGAKDVTLKVSPYAGIPRAFTINPAAEDLQTLSDLLEYTWGTRRLSVLDPFAGGGSIPLEALRYGFTTFANELNPVATTILKATLDYPARFGPDLAEDIRKWGYRWAEIVKKKLKPYFPKRPDENIFAYLWARTVQWRGRTVPLSPNWWLSVGDKPVAVRLIADPDSKEPRFEILEGRLIGKYDPDQGTISRGVGRCPWTGETIDSDYIKAKAQAGRMGQVLYAVTLKKRDGFTFRPPTQEDIEAACYAEEEMAHQLTYWVSRNLIPSERIPEGLKTMEPSHYGISTWNGMFSPRQLLSVGTMAEVRETLINELQEDKRESISTYSAIVLDKIIDYNCLFATWESSRKVVKHLFKRHDFGFSWSYGEFDASSNLLSWAVDQVVDAYADLAKLTYPTQQLFAQDGTKLVERLDIRRGSAADLAYLANGSITNITVDPPYYDNVQYAELSDFFYVWLKRSVGHLFSEFFTDELTNKDDEAVANPARFASLGSKKKILAEQDYERKMAAAFREMHRVLHPDGVLTVMFTHKKVEAWDTLASALIGAGFTIQASWPVHTESERSLHQVKKNAAASTILLVCRKRTHPTSGEGLGERSVWWEDMQAEVRRVAREKAAEYANLGISGADLYISTFGPTLSVISQNWPVLTSEVDPKTGQPKPLRPEIALDLAREEVVRLRKQGLLAGREVQFDSVTDWYLMAWDAYAAEQFPYDEARKLAIALGVDLDHDLMRIKRLAQKKGEYIIMQTPVERRKTGMVDDESTSFTHWIDAAHTAMMIYSEDGAGACDLFLQKSGLKRDTTFKALLQTMINAIPRIRIKGKFVRPEAEVLENMRLAFFSDELTAPKEEEPELPQEKQLGFGFSEIDEAEEENEDIQE